MKHNLTQLFLSGLLSFQALAAQTTPVDKYASYLKAVNATAQMPTHKATVDLAKKFGLDVLNVTWEDTGRTKNSSIGPNISDMTIQVHTLDKEGDIVPVAMPVIRHPNFSDKTADLSPNDFFLLIGNEKGEDLEKISLTEYLDNFRNYLSDQSSWTGEENSLLAARDSHVLVSAQATFLPIPEQGKASFNPVLFNYQSYEENPAVLAILATREGTSATVIDNKRDTFKNGWGQRLFFNANGEKASLTGERLQDFRNGLETNIEPSVGANKQTGLNMVLLIQVPLKYKERPFNQWLFGNGLETIAFSMAKSTTSIEEAVIGHGPVEGPFVEIDQLAIERDERFPIRVTVQFYQATDKPELNEDELIKIKNQLNQVYKNADYVGSLVTEGKTLRPTEHNVDYPTWWPIFFPYQLADQVIEADTAELILQQTYGAEWMRMLSSQEKLEQALQHAQALK